MMLRNSSLPIPYHKRIVRASDKDKAKGEKNTKRQFLSLFSVFYFTFTCHTLYLGFLFSLLSPERSAETKFEDEKLRSCVGIGTEKPSLTGEGGKGTVLA